MKVGDKKLGCPVINLYVRIHRKGVLSKQKKETQLRFVIGDYSMDKNERKARNKHRLCRQWAVFAHKKV